ncbi:MAG: response regulator [Bdellovibrionota bacterium]
MDWNTKKKIRVLVVDDSIVMQKFITGTINEDPDLEVVGTAADPFEGRDKLVSLMPDVVTLDIEMPRMDGITFLKAIMQHRPTPVVVCSNVVGPGSAKEREAKSAGAAAVICKVSDSDKGLELLKSQIVDAIKRAAKF